MYMYGKERHYLIHAEWYSIIIIIIIVIILLIIIIIIIINLYH